MSIKDPMRVFRPFGYVGYLGLALILVAVWPMTITAVVILWAATERDSMVEVVGVMVVASSVCVLTSLWWIPVLEGIFS